MFEELKKKNSDLKVLEANAEKSGQIFTNLRKKTYEHFLSIKSIFTPEQQSKYFGYIEKRSCCGKGNPDMKCNKNGEMKCKENIGEKKCKDNKEGRKCCK
jgi:hypothetical protein